MSKFLDVDFEIDSNEHFQDYQIICPNGKKLVISDLFFKYCGESYLRKEYLPQEVNDDWFEVQPEPISVKNRHLINITTPIGVNTIGTSLRNASWDIRGTPACPKYVVSPFLNSSIEPDTNLKPLL